MAQHHNTTTDIRSYYHRLYRTDFFPGLGWMMARALWEEIGGDWPEQNWDHWMRGEEARARAGRKDSD